MTTASKLMVRSGPTLEEVARRAGVAKSSVSHVLNASESECRLSSETRARVLEAVAELGYRPNWRAKMLRQGKSNTIGLLIKHAIPYMYPIASEILGEACRVLESSEYHVLFLPQNNLNSTLEAIQDHRVDGCLVIDLLEENVADELSRLKIPTVLINQMTERRYFPQILADDEQGCRLAMDHLLNLGHRKFLFYRHLSSFALHYSTIARVQEFKRRLAEAGLSGEEIGGVSAEEIVARVKLGAGEVSAVVCYSQMEALELMAVLWQKGLRVPQDVSIVAFNDVYPSEYLIPPLTTVAVPARQMAQIAAQMLVEWLGKNFDDAGYLGANRVLPETLVVRQSTAAAGA